ncbi:MAG: hypothetical protein KF861_05035 [Planctomycetaceae bacterium]|nr:hypothetical protein [Planctomycetaceae bacterium]
MRLLVWPLRKSHVGCALLVTAVGFGGNVHRVDADDELDRQLLESLEGPPASEVQSPAALISRLLENTHTARLRLEAGQLDEQTAGVQQQILDDLDALLRQTGTPPLPSSEGSRSPAGGADAAPSEGNAQGNEQLVDAPDSRSSDGADGKGSPANDPNAPARESTERTTAGTETAAERERRLGLATAAWGHLPPKVREQMRSAFSETYLPEYDELLRRYYEALAARRDPPATTGKPPAP